MILIRRYYSNSKYQETPEQIKDRESNAAKGAAIGGIIGAGLYGLNRKNLIKQNEEKNRRLAMRRERLAGKQKED